MRLSLPVPLAFRVKQIMQCELFLPDRTEDHIAAGDTFPGSAEIVPANSVRLVPHLLDRVRRSCYSAGKTREFRGHRTTTATDTHPTYIYDHNTDWRRGRKVGVRRSEARIAQWREPFYRSGRGRDTCMYVHIRTYVFLYIYIRL